MRLFALFVASLFSPESVPGPASAIDIKAIDDMEAAVVIAAINARAGQPEIELYFNSPGGYVSAGLEIIRAMERAQDAGSRFVCTAEMAASMGAVIYASCDIRLALPRAMFLFHGAAVRSGGNDEAHRQIAEELEVTTDALLRHIARVTNISFKELKKRCKGRDYWLDAGRAQRIGFVQEILP